MNQYDILDEHFEKGKPKKAPLRFRDMVNPRKWRAFILGTILEKYVGFHYCEQIVYRSIMCRPCVDKGSCVGCGCSMPDALMAPNNTCSEGNWSFMMDKEIWESYKKDSGFQFNISINLSKPKSQ